MSKHTKMSNKKQKKELSIYDPEGMDPETNISYEEVKVPMQEHITAVRRAFSRSWTSVKDASSRVSRDTRDNLIGVIGKARKQANSVLSSVGVEDSRQVLRGSAVVGASLLGLYLARRKSMFRKVLYPLLGVGLVGGAIYRDRLYAEYREIERHYRSNVAAWQSGGATNLEQNVRSHTEEAIKKESGEASTNLERSIRSQIEAAVRKEAENGRKQN